MLRHQHEDFHDRVRGVGEHLIVHRFNVKVANLETFVQGANFIFAAAANDGFVIILQDHVGQLRQCKHSAVVLLHHQFHTQAFAFVLVPEHLRQRSLVVKQQSIFVAVGQ